MKPMTSEEYVAKQGQVCPYCHTDQLEGQEVNIEDGQAWQEMSCSNCEASWTDQYQLIGFNPTFEPADLNNEGDYKLTAEQLDEKYNQDGDGEHPVIERLQWMQAVQQGDTLVGYWDWVVHQLWERRAQ